MYGWISLINHFLKKIKNPTLNRFIKFLKLFLGFRRKNKIPFLILNLGEEAEFWIPDLGRFSTKG
jgi:hypothetical protein